MQRRQIKSFTGIDDPYEEPLNPHITCDTAKETIDKSKSVAKVTTWLEAANKSPGLNILTNFGEHLEFSSLTI